MQDGVRCVISTARRCWCSSGYGRHRQGTGWLYVVVGCGVVCRSAGPVKVATGPPAHGNGGLAER